MTFGSMVPIVLKLMLLMYKASVSYQHQYAKILHHCPLGHLLSTSSKKKQDQNQGEQRMRVNRQQNGVVLTKVTVPNESDKSPGSLQSCADLPLSFWMRLPCKVGMLRCQPLPNTSFILAFSPPWSFSWWSCCHILPKTLEVMWVPRFGSCAATTPNSC